MVGLSVIAASALLALSFLPVTAHSQILRGSPAIPKLAPIFTPAACNAAGPICPKGQTRNASDWLVVVLGGALPADLEGSSNHLNLY
jgi:hypothetical protein